MPSIFSGLDPISNSSGSSLSSQDKEKLNKLKTDGDGTKFLNDKLQYVEVSGHADIDDTTPASDKVYSSQKVEDEFAKKSDVDVDNIKKEVAASVKTDFFSKQETQDYIDNKLDTKVDKVSGMGLSKNSFEDNYKDILDNLDTSKFVIDENYVHTDNNLTNELKDKILASTGGTNYIGLFEDLNERDSYSEPLVSGYWCAINSDTSHENKKTKYYYNGTEWIFDGYYSDSNVTIDDNNIDNSKVWSSEKTTTELNKKANKLDVDTSIDEINDKLDNKLEITNLKAGTNISIDVDQYGNATFNSTASGSSTTGGTSNYELLSNKPRVNNISIIGNKTSKDLGLLDISYASDVNENSVKKADSICVPDDVVLNSDYGIDINGNLGYHPRIPIPNEITSYIFPMLTKDIRQSLPIKSEGINYMIQCYAKQTDSTNVEEVFESYGNPIVTNHSDNVETVEDNGSKITQIKNTIIYKSTNSETGFHEFAIDFSKYIYLNSIEEVDNNE